MKVTAAGEVLLPTVSIPMTAALKVERSGTSSTMSLKSSVFGRAEQAVMPDVCLPPFAWLPLRLPDLKPSTDLESTRNGNDWVPEGNCSKTLVFIEARLAQGEFLDSIPRRFITVRPGPQFGTDFETFCTRGAEFRISVAGTNSVPSPSAPEGNCS